MSTLLVRITRVSANTGGTRVRSGCDVVRSLMVPFAGEIVLNAGRFTRRHCMLMASELLVSAGQREKTRVILPCWGA
ncbi:hypothetical protein GCM10009771_24870 [Nesterenkonia flava]